MFPISWKRHQPTRCRYGEKRKIARVFVFKGPGRPPVDQKQKCMEIAPQNLVREMEKARDFLLAITRELESVHNELHGALGDGRRA